MVWKYEVDAAQCLILEMIVIIIMFPFEFWHLELLNNLLQDFNLLVEELEDCVAIEEGKKRCELDLSQFFPFLLILNKVHEFEEVTLAELSVEAQEGVLPLIIIIIRVI